MGLAPMASYFAFGVPNPAAIDRDKGLKVGTAG